MIYAVISDVHANVEALRAVIADASAQGAGKIVCLGDVVGYGPMPEATVAAVREWCDVVLAGNHDDAVSNRSGAEDFIDLAGDAIERHREELSSESIRWLRELPYFYEGDGFVAAHGDFVSPEKFFYVEDEADAGANFNAVDAQLMFVGHTHIPKLSLVGASGTVYMAEPQDFTMEPGKRYIVNPGSVGYPRESGGKCFSSYVLYDSQERTVVFRYLPFNVSTLLQRGKSSRRKGLVASLALAVALAVSALSALLLFRPGEKPDVENAIAQLLVDSATLDVSSSSRVSANLKLSKESCPLQLSVTFKDGNGMPTGVEKLTVKRSSMKKFSVPEGSKTAVFELRKNSEKDVAAVESFRPEGVRR